MINKKRFFILCAILALMCLGCACAEAKASFEVGDLIYYDDVPVGIVPRGDGTTTFKTGYLTTDVPYIILDRSTDWDVHVSGGTGPYTVSAGLAYQTMDKHQFSDPWTVVSSFTVKDFAYSYTFTDEGRYFWKISVTDSLGESISFKTRIYESYSEADETDATTTAGKANAIVDELIDDSMSDYTRALVLHDWLIHNAEYDTTYTNYDASGVLLEGTGVCDSYARAYLMLCTAAGVECIYVSGTAGRASDPSVWENHGWNMIRLSDGWYHVDCTHDDPLPNGNERHTFFCVDDETIAATHRWNRTDDKFDTDGVFAPAAEGGKYEAVDAEGDHHFTFATMDEFEAEFDALVAAGKRYATTTGLYTGSESVSDFWNNEFSAWVQPKAQSLANQGLVTGLSAGVSGNLFSYILTWVDPTPAIRVDETALRLSVGEKKTVVPVTVDPVADVFTWTSGDTDVATVSCAFDAAAENPVTAVITAVSPGETTVTLASADGISDTIDITVLAPYAPDMGVVATETAEGLSLSWNSVPGVTEYRVMCVYNGLETCVATTQNLSVTLGDDILPYSRTQKVYVLAVRAINGTDVVTYPSPAFTYGSAYSVSVNDDGTLTVTGYSGDETHVIIPDTIRGAAVTGIGDGVFASRRDLLSVSIPDTVRSIGNNAFIYCSGLTEIILPDALETIGDHAFFDCGGLDRAVFPKGLTALGEGAFGSCDGIKAITLPDSLKSIPVNAFSSCGALEYIYIPASVQGIGSGALSDGFAGKVYCGDTGYLTSWAERMCFDYAVISDEDAAKDMLIILPENLLLGAGKTLDLSPAIIPVGHTDPAITWTTSNSAAATVSGGAVTGVAVGEAVITAGISGASDTCAVSVVPLAEKLTLPESFTVLSGKAIELTGEDFGIPLTVEPAGAYTELTFATGDELLAFINDYDQLVGVSGETTLSVTDKASGLTATCRLITLTDVTAIEFESADVAIADGVITTRADKHIETRVKVSLDDHTCYNEMVTFSSSDTSVASVGYYNGAIHTIAPGTAVITATANSGVTASITVNVVAPPERFYISGSIHLLPGDTHKVEVIVEPADATVDIVMILEENEHITLSEDGVLTGVSTGTAMLTVKDAISDSSCTVTVECSDTVNSVWFNTYSYIMEPGDTEALEAHVDIGDCGRVYINRAVTFASSDENAATVDRNGVVTAVGAGKAVITATAANGESDKVSVEVRVPATKLSLPEVIYILPGQTIDIPLTVEPAGAYINPSVGIEDMRIADNTSTQITGISVGSTYLHFSDMETGLSATAQVKCVNGAQKLTLPEVIYLLPGDEIDVPLVIEPANAYADIAMTLSGSEHITLTADSKLAGSADGEATLTVSEALSGQSATALVKRVSTVTGIALNETSMFMMTGDSAKLEADVSFGDYVCKNRMVTFASSDEGVVTVDQSGNVIAVAPGEAFITVSAESGVTAECAVSVAIPVQKLILPEVIYLLPGDTMPFTVTVEPANAYRNIVFAIDDTQFAVMGEGQSITGIAEGEAVLTATDTAGGVSATARVKCVATVTGITLSTDALTLVPGASAKVTASVSFGDYVRENRMVTFASSDEGVATVDQNGNVTAVGDGEALITVSAESGVTAQCAVTVKAPTPMLLPASLIHIGDEAFMESGAEYVIIPKTTVSIGKKAFANCPTLAYIVIPETVTSIDTTAFSGSDNVTIIAPEGSIAHGIALALTIPWLAG